MVNSWNPVTLEDALKVKKENPQSLPYAGGTDWMVARNEQAELLFLNHIPSLKEVSEDEKEVCIGSGCIYADLLQIDAVPPVLKMAISQIAAPAIRNVGTIGGNVCNASPAGDTLPVLYALDAQLRLASLDDDDQIVFRQIPIDEFIHGVRKTDLRANELLTHIIIPKEHFTHVYYHKVGARNAQAISKVSFAGLARIENNEIVQIRIAFGSVGATVVRKKELETFVTGHNCIEMDNEMLTQLYGSFLHPIDDQRSTAVYRKKICINLLGDFLNSLSNRDQSILQ